MNKILIDEYEVNLKDIDGILDIQVDHVHIHLQGINHITDLQLNECKNVIITLSDQTSLILNAQWNNVFGIKEMTINSQNNTHFEGSFFIDVLKDFQFIYSVNLLGSQNKNESIFHVITEENGRCYMKTTGTIKKDTKENELLEELKGLTIFDSNITFLPELIVDSDDVIANHNSTIRMISEEELFYLKSKGINQEQAKELIKKGFLNKKAKEVENES